MKERRGEGRKGNEKEVKKRKVEGRERKEEEGNKSIRKKRK